jgi:dihydropteroate synthase
LVDPGFGFGKSWRQNLELIRRLGELRSLATPVLVGPSRKGTIARVLGGAVDDRLEGTAALATLAVAGGTDILRVHDVAAMARVARIADRLSR